MEYVFLFIVLIVIVLIVTVAMYMHHLRVKFWQELARQWGLRYSSGDVLKLRSRHDFALFQQGHSKTISHMIHGEVHGRQIALFDYSYKTGSGKNQSTHSLSALVLEMPVAAPALTVRPESVMDRFAAFFGFDDINFELDQFNRCFHVKCADKRFAYDVFHAGMMEYLLEHQALSLEWRIRHLLVYSWSVGTFNRAEAEEMWELANGFAARLPEYLINKAGV